MSPPLRSTLFIEFDGRQLSVMTDVPEARRFLEAAFRHMLVSGVTVSAGAFSFVTTSGGFLLESAERYEYPGVPVEQLLPLVKDEVRLHFMRSRSDLLWLHAGAVATSKGAVLLAAPSGQGKSSISTALVERGWRFLSDDIAPVRMDANRVMPFPQTPVRRLHPGSEVASADVWQLQRESVAISTGLIGRSDASIAHVVFVNYAAEATTKIEQLRPGSGAMEILRNLTNFVDHKASAVSRVAELAQCVPLFRLQYSSVTEAAEAINNLELSQSC